MIETNTTTAPVLNLNTYQKLMDLHNSIEALSDFANLESEQQILQIIVKSCRESFLSLAPEILQSYKS